MTGPLHDADVTIGVDVDGSTVPGQVREIADDIGRESEPDFRRTGQDLGDGLGQGVAKGVRRQRKAVAHELERLVPVRGKFVFQAFRNIDTGEIVRRRVFRELREGLEHAAEDAFDEVTKKGGIFSKIGEGISDAVGAGFNVSGRSKLIPLLIPAIGALINLITAAVAALQPLLTLLITLPQLLGGIAAQFGVLMIVFRAVGPNISALLNAKDVKELAAAVKGLSPAVKDFVISLLPLRQLFADIKRQVVDNFFAGIGTNIKGLIDLLSPLLKSGLGNLAFSLGMFFHNLIQLMQGPVFQTFLNDVFTSTVEWVNTFGPAFLIFLDGLLRAGHIVLPLLMTFGEQFSGFFKDAGEALAKFADDPDSKEFIKTTQDLLVLTFRLLKTVGKFILSFIDVIATSGGKDAIESIILNLEILMAFFESPAGRLAVKGFIDLLIFLTYAFTVMVVAITIVLGFLGALADFLQFLVLAIFQFFSWVLDQVINLAKEIGSFPGKFVAKIVEWSLKVRKAIAGWFAGVSEWFYEKGKQLADELAQGFLDKAKAVATSLVLGNAAAEMIKSLDDHFPHSPAKKGPFSGSGAPAERGKSTMKEFIMGMASESRSLSTTTSNIMSNINFGPGAVRVQYNGVSPTPEQARITGSAIGTGIAGQLALRNTRLAVRTL